MKNRWLIVLLAAVVALLPACAEAATESTEASTESAAPTQLSETAPPEPEPLPDAWADYGAVITYPFNDNELREARDMAEESLTRSAPRFDLIRLCYDPVLTHHDCVEAYAAQENPDWTLEHYFANRVSMTYEITGADENGTAVTRQGSIRLRRASDRELWQAGEPVELQCEQSALLRDSGELAVVFDNCLCGYELADGTLMAYCRKGTSNNIGLEIGKLPWEPKAEAKTSDFYFGESCEYTDGDLNYEPGWLGGELEIRPGEDGLLGLYRNGELLWTYFDAAYTYQLTESWIYYLEEGAIRRVDYAGRENQLLFTGERISDTFYVGQGTVFFICQTNGASGVYRLYAEDRRCELLGAEVPVPLEDVGLNPPISNCQIVWSYINPEFTELAESNRAEYEAQYGELDDITYYGMLEQDYGIYSQISCYINTLTDEYYELRSGWVYLQPERTEENIEKNGSAWWQDFQTEEPTVDHHSDLEDANA